jgi:nickel superoxide dismutase
MIKFNLNLPVAEAHCDIPCKIYDPAISLIAATTIVRLIDLLDEINNPSDLASGLKISRIAASKEEHAMIVKKEVATIWGDYFKAPQLEQFPETDRLVHDIMMNASACKQGCDRADALSLIEKLNDFAKIFWTTKGFETELLICPYPPEVPVCYPVLKSV